MSLPRRTALGVSIAVILLYWIYQLSARPGAAALPTEFSELMFRIVRDKLLVLGAVGLLLRLGGERLDNLGLRRDGWPKHLGIGLLIGVAMFIGLNVGLTSAMNALIPRTTVSGPSVAAFFHQPVNLLIWLPIGILGGGVVEELQRIFVLTRFEKWLGRPGLIAGVTLSSVMFGFGHLYQGVGTAIAAAISGLVFALVYLRRRSAVEPIVAHAFSDVLAMVAATLLAR